MPALTRRSASQDEGQAVLVEDRLERAILGIGQQPGDGDGLVDPAERAVMVAPFLVMVTGVEHGGAVGGLRVHDGGGTGGTGVIVDVFCLGRAPESGQAGRHLHREVPPRFLCGVPPIEDGATAPPEVDRRFVEAHVEAVDKGLAE
jgi:hypothetical protein